MKLKDLPQNDDLQTVIKRYPKVFNEGLGTEKGIKAKIYVDANARPHYFKPRHVPYAIRVKIEEELIRLEKERAIEPVQYSKRGQDYKSGDYKVTVNEVSKLDNYAIHK